MSYAQQADRIQRGQRGYTPPPLERVAGSKTIINTLVDIDEKMDFYEAELPLDAFEKEVLKNMIVDFEEKKMALHADENIGYKIREEQVLKLEDQFRADLGGIFPAEKVDKFFGLHFMDEKLLKKKKKRGRKEKKNKTN
jgi:hypothetical protein